MGTYTRAISPVATDDDYFFAAAAVGAAGALTLLKTLLPGGLGFKLLFTSAGNSSARTWTIVGHKVGTSADVVTTETITAPNATTGLTTNYYDSITSVTASGAMTGDQKVGFSSTTYTISRVSFHGVHWVSVTTTAGSLVATDSAGNTIFRVDTPASAAPEAGFVNLGHIRGFNNPEIDYALITATNVTYYTLICG